MSDLTEIKDDVKQILKIINGNGKLGLVGKVTVIWSVGLFLTVSVIGLLLRVFILQ